MFELEDYSVILSKYADSSGPTLDFYISDSMQDMLDVDIRSEIENVVGSADPDFLSASSNMHYSLEQSLNGSNSGSNHNSGSNSYSNGNNILQSVSSWYGINTGPSWSSSSHNDYYADIGACVNPISVMPLISSSTMIHKSPKANLNSSGLPPPPASPNARETSKSHLTFSPAQIKVSAGSIRHEQIHSHIPKQIVAISSSVTAGTTAPATMATNSALQRKVGGGSAVDAIKKDLGAELRRSSVSSDEYIKTGSGAVGMSNNVNINGTTPSSTIKLAPGIGGLTFANSITYNKLKQQSTTKSPQGSPVASNGSTITIKRDRDSSSPMRALTNGGQSVSKILARNMVQSANGFTPKSIASAHSPLININSGGSSGSIGSPSSASSMSASCSSSPSSGSSGFNGSFSAGLAPLNGQNLSSIRSSSPCVTKSLQQKVNKPPSGAAVTDSDYPKPAYSYSCLIAMALKNSRSGSLPVSEIYSFMCEHFPYFNTAPSGWKNSVRHNLSLNKCFEKIEKPATNGNQRKGCLWAMNPDRITKMDEEVQKWSRKDPAAIRNAMVYPEHLEALERGEMKHGSSADSEVELDSQSEIEDTSDLEEPEDMDETIVDSMFVEEDVEDDDDFMAATGGDDDHMLGNGVVVMNEPLNIHEENDDELCMVTGIHHNIDENDIDDEIDEHELLQQHHQNHRHQQQQQQRDFDTEVEDFYDSIDVEDDKEAVRMAINQSDIIELSPADMKVNGNGHVRIQSPKRARLDVNYSIGPVGELEKHLLKQQQQQQQFKKFRLVQQHQQQQQQQQNHQQHFIVQSITNGGGTSTTTPAITTANIATYLTSNSSNNNNIGNKTNNNNNNIILQKQIQHMQQFQNVTTIPQQHNRRKMQLVNRIA